MGKARGGGLDARTAAGIELNAATGRRLREGQSFEEVVAWARERAGGDVQLLNDQARAHVAAWLSLGDASRLRAAAVLATAAGVDPGPADAVAEIMRRGGLNWSHLASGVSEAPG